MFCMFCMARIYFEVRYNHSRHTTMHSGLGNTCTKNCITTQSKLSEQPTLIWEVAPPIQCVWGEIMFDFKNNLQNTFPRMKCMVGQPPRSINIGCSLKIRFLAQYVNYIHLLNYIHAIWHVQGVALLNEQWLLPYMFRGQPYWMNSGCSPTCCMPSNVYYFLMYILVRNNYSPPKKQFTVYSVHNIWWGHLHCFFFFIH